MKKKILNLVFIGIPLTFLLLTNGCFQPDYEKKAYLQKVVNNLQQLKSASYSAIKKGFLPGDTTPSFVSKVYYKEYDNPGDSTIGAKFVRFSKGDTSKMTFCYDGNMRARVNYEKKYIEIDSFKNNKLPFRPVTPPFFNYTQSIIKYALETKDSTKLQIKDLGNSIFFSLKIYDSSQVEFFGKPYHIDSPYGLDQEISQYEIWIDKSNDLPFKINREMSHDRSVTICENISVSKQPTHNFTASEYFPNFPLKSELKEDPGKIKLKGKKAPSWTLRDTENKMVSLKDLKSKVILIQFTGIGCGACRTSIPFLKQLVSDYHNKSFELISIETWNSNPGTLKRYKERKEMNFKFLNATEEVIKKYQIQLVPIFFILDKNREIKQIIKGYRKEKTDEEIRKFLDEMV